MKKGDLYYLAHNPKSKVLVMKTFNKREFTDCAASFHGFPSIRVTPAVKVVFVAGNRKGEKDNFVQEQFNQHFIKVEDKDGSR